MISCLLTKTQAKAPVLSNFCDFSYTKKSVFLFKICKDWQWEPAKGVITHRLGCIIWNCQLMTIFDFLKCHSHPARSDLEEHYIWYRKDGGPSDRLLYDFKQLILFQFPPLQNVDDNAYLSGPSDSLNAIMDKAAQPLTPRKLSWNDCSVKEQ